MQKVVEIQGSDYIGERDADDPIEFAVPMEASGLRVDVALAKWLPRFSRARLQAWIAAGRVTVDSLPASAKQRLRGGEAMCVLPQVADHETAFAAEAIALEIVFEDAALIVLNKPPGLVAHPAAGNWSGTLLNALLHHAPALAGVPRAGIVHRLDKDTSGLLVVAKTIEAQTALVRQLQARTVRREYWALVAGRLGPARAIDAAIGRHPVQRLRMAVLPADAPGARSAVTHVRVIKTCVRDALPATLVECRLETGRTHQIRVHMQHVGHPVVGDQTYGRAPYRAWLPRQALHARRLGFEHPDTSHAMAWEASLPHDMQALIDSLEDA